VESKAVGGPLYSRFNEIFEYLRSEFKSPQTDKMSFPASYMYQYGYQIQILSGDCVGAGDRIVEYLSNSETIDPSWVTARTFLLEWGVCLARMSGMSTDGEVDSLILEASAVRSYAELWAKFFSMANNYEPLFRHDETTEGLEVKKLHGIAALILDQ
jgi:hypothetical protein